MFKQAQLEFAKIELVRQEVFYIKLGNRVTLELDMARTMIGACNQMLTSEGRYCGYIIDMSGAAFVTEDARNFITEVNTHRGKVEALALVSNNHLGNIISTLVISFADTDTFPMQLFKKTSDAEDWLYQLISSAKRKLLKTA
ncbi:hypothetical protein OAE48_01105 [Flavobacteriales bacterium]|nr:hypothetical protein [Flavobacteriales bacterium]